MADLPKAKVPKEYQDPFLHCRTFGHTWIVGGTVPDGMSYYQFVLVCDVCHCRRIDVINVRTGALATARRYEYPEGYQSARGEGLARTTYRREFIRRLKR